MLRIFDYFKRKKLVPALKENELRSRPTQYRPIRSSGLNGDGDFTFYVGEEALSAMRKHAGIAFEELESLPGRVLSKCRELGFAHNGPTHFLFEIQEIPRDPCWTVTKIVPPIEIESGKPSERSIVVFMPTVQDEIKTTKNEVLTAATMYGLYGELEKKEQFIAAAPAIIKAKYKTLLTHEMVHVFATDEYREIMVVLGLDLLELLTDSINLVTFYPDYKKHGDFPKMGLTEGIGYLANLLRREEPTRVFGLEIVDLAHERAIKIIRQCQIKCKEAGLSFTPGTPGLTRRNASAQAARAL